MSFKSTQSQLEEDSKKEQLPILLADEDEFSTLADNSSDQNDVTSKINNNVNGRMWRESSYKFWNDKANNIVVGELTVNDLTFGRLGKLINFQENSDEISLEIDELLNDQVTTSRDSKVTFSHTSSVTERRPKNSTDSDDSENMDVSEVVKCSSSNVHQHKPTWMARSKPRSRLLDPVQPDPYDRKSGQRSYRSGQHSHRSGLLRSGLMRSGLLFSGRTDEEEDDPFLDADLPEDCKTVSLGFITMAEVITLVLIIGALISSLTVPALRRETVWGLALWKWLVLGLSLICGRLVSASLMRVVVFCVMRNFMLRKRLLYFVFGLRRSVQNCIWLGMVLISWHLLFDENVASERRSRHLEYMSEILVCFLIGTVIWLFKTLLVKVLASYFHVNTFFDRIHDSLFNQYVIETLSGPPLVEMKRVEDEEARFAEDIGTLQNAGADVPPELIATVSAAKSGVIRKSGEMEQETKSVKRSHMLSGAIKGREDDHGIPIEHFHRMNPKNVSAWNMKRLIKIVRYGTLKTLDEQLLDTTEEDEKQMYIRSEVEAKAAAKKIFHNVAKPHSKSIRLEDLMRFMEKDEAERTLSLFEGASETGKISKSSLKNWVVKAFRERRALSLTLNDTKTAVNRLHQMVNVVVIVIIGLITLTFLGVTTRKLIVVFGSQIVVCAFIFGNTLKNIFEALVYLFIVHPFDVGDRCEIEGKEYVVEEMNILSTVFLRDDNLKVTYMNFWLAMRAVHNFYRSPDMGDAVDFCVHIATPTEKIALIKQKLTSYMESRKDLWASPMMVMRDVVELEMVKFSLWFCHTINFQDMGERFKRRAQLVEEMVKIFKEVDLDYRKYRISKMEETSSYVQRPGPVSTRMPPTWAPPTARN